MTKLKMTLTTLLLHHSSNGAVANLARFHALHVKLSGRLITPSLKKPGAPKLTMPWPR
jgi:hypothetical protein